LGEDVGIPTAVNSFPIVPDVLFVLLVWVGHGCVLY
jgi:hypothetical protein